MTVVFQYSNMWFIVIMTKIMLEVTAMFSTDFLFAKPSFFGGMASTLDVGATLTVYNESQSPAEADAKALASDWQMVGEDLKGAISDFEKSHGE